MRRSRRRLGGRRMRGQMTEGFRGGFGRAAGIPGGLSRVGLGRRKSRRGVWEC